MIVGGGFHGKSTLFVALQVGMYNKLPGDDASNSSAFAKFKAPFGSVTPRCPVGEAHKVAVRSKTVVAYGDVELDLAGLSNLLVESKQMQSPWHFNVLQHWPLRARLRYFRF